MTSKLPDPRKIDELKFCRLLNKKFKRIELTLTSSVSRALSHKKSLLNFMRYAPFPGTGCRVLLTKAGEMGQMNMHS